jgi:two-component system sensor histidine kinase/response regulator
VEEIKNISNLSGAIVMMITSGHRGNLEGCRDLGIAAHLLKPIRQSELLSALLAALGQGSSSSATAPPRTDTLPEASIKVRILVAEDNPVNQKVVVRMLEKAGHSPLVAHNGREALAMLEAGTFDLVFMDVQMPEIDGLTATRNIRENEKLTGKHIPIVAMTAHAVKGDKERCLAAGMDAYLSKPVSSDRITETIALFFNQTIHEPSPIPVVRASSSAWDPDKALERVDGDKVLLRELLQIFLGESPKQLASLRQAIETADSQTIESIAHTLKGELGYLGLPDAAQKAKDLERMGRERELRLASDLFVSFETEVTAVTQVMQDMLDTKIEVAHQ